MRSVSVVVVGGGIGGLSAALALRSVGAEVRVYEHALSFFDRIVDEGQAREIQVRDRLDAQGVVWTITKTPADAPPRDR